MFQVSARVYQALRNLRSALADCLGEQARPQSTCVRVIALREVTLRRAHVVGQNCTEQTGRPRRGLVKLSLCGRIVGSGGGDARAAYLFISGGTEWHEGCQERQLPSYQ